jgi:phospholipase/lecithinase/hemolysin
MHSSLLRRLAALVVIGLAPWPAAQATPYSSLVVFGDSLSDTGNVLSLTQVFTPATPFPSYPAAPGRFSNGPVWTDVLAAGLNLPLGAMPANLLFDGSSVMPIGAPGGANYAFGGARTGLGGSAGATTGLFGQLVNWNGGTWASGLTRAADPNALYVVLAGANDLRDARSAAPGGSATEAGARSVAAQNTATGVLNAVGLLAQAGARHVLIGTLPDLGKTPEAVTQGVVDASTDVTLKFNAALTFGAAQLDTQLAALGIDLDLITMDLYGLALAVYDDATNNGGAHYGIGNFGNPCLTPGPFSHQYFAPDAGASQCELAAFSDDLHPSAAMHALIGQLALRAVPEPDGLALATLALLALVVGRRAKRRA